MTSPAVQLEPASPYAELGFFDDNLQTLALPAATWREARAAEPAGRIVLDADRTPQIELDGRILGASLSEDQIEAYTARISQRTVFIVFGLGMGHVARALRAATSAPVVVFEPHPGLLRRVLESGPTDLGDIPIFTNLHDLAGVWLKIGLSKLEGIVVRSPGYSEAFPEPLLALPAAVHETFQRINITENTYQLRARTWVDDVLANLKTIAGTVPFVSLLRRFEGVLAFIVGAGPSLDKNVALLKEARDKGIVFAVNSSARALARNGVDPQVLACIESHDSSHLLAELPFIDRVVRAFSICAAPNILATGKGPLLPIHEALPQLEAPLRELMGVPGLAVCGSVSTAAFSLAEALGCNPIVFVGQDQRSERRPSDDAAGLAISEGMKSQIRSYTVAERNAADGVSMAQTAEGALGDVHDVLGRMRELAMQSSNGSLTSTDRGYMNTEFGLLQKEVSRIQASAKFNGQPLIGSASTGITFQVGLDNSTNDQIKVDFGGLALTTLTNAATGGTSISGTTSSNALAALGNIDAAIGKVSTSRSKFGAAMNRLAVATSNIQTMRLNLSAANSRIRDVDVASETASMSRNQVLTQAGISVLAQANQLPQQAFGLIGR